MKLCILGAESLDELEKLARDLFSHVPNKSLSTYRVTDVKPYEDEHLNKILSCVPVKEQRKLSLFWPVMPSYVHQYHSKPSKYYSHLLGHESEGSIFAIIKEKGWASALVAGLSTQNQDFEIFKIDIELTEDGFEKREEILSIVFDYIHLLNKAEPERWIFEEIKKLAETRFRFLSKKSPINFCTAIAGDMQYYSPEHYLIGSFLYSEFDPQNIKKYLSYLTPQNLIIMQVAKTFFTRM